MLVTRLAIGLVLTLDAGHMAIVHHADIVAVIAHPNSISIICSRYTRGLYLHVKFTRT